MAAISDAEQATAEMMRDMAQMKVQLKSLLSDIIPAVRAARTRSASCSESQRRRAGALQES